MASRPAHLTDENAGRFQDLTVVDAYRLRLPYPPEVFDVLVGLIADPPGAVLDVGTGTGELARSLVPRVDRVDAIDISARMIARGKTLPGGDHPRLRWIEARAEYTPLLAPYALITAGESLHWMDWDVVLPRLQSALSPRGRIAILGREAHRVPWQEGLNGLIAEYSTSQNYQPYDLVEELERRHLFEQAGKHETAPVSFRQSIDDYIESFHSRSSLSRDNMAPDASAAFDRELRKLVEPWSNTGAVDLQTVGSITWGQ